MITQEWGVAVAMSLSALVEGSPLGRSTGCSSSVTAEKTEYMDTGPARGVDVVVRA